VTKIDDLSKRLDNVAARGDPVTKRERILWRGVVGLLSEEEQENLCGAIVTLEKSHGTASLESLPAAQRAAFEKAHDLYEKLSTPRGVGEFVREGGERYAAQQEARRQELKALTSRTPNEEQELQRLEEDAKRLVKIGDELDH
jgi:hypothetical protein